MKKQSTYKEYVLTVRDRLTPELVKALEERTMTNAEVAKKLGVHEKYLSAVFNSLSKRKRGEVAEQREFASLLAQCRREMRQHEAALAVRGEKTPQEAAKEAHCSLRTIYRYMDESKGAANGPD